MNEPSHDGDAPMEILSKRTHAGDVAFVATSVLSGALLIAAFYSQPWVGAAGLLLGGVAEAQAARRSRTLRSVDRHLRFGARMRLASGMILMVGAIAIYDRTSTSTALLAGLFAISYLVGISGISALLAASYRKPIPTVVRNLDVQLPLAEVYKRRRTLNSKLTRYSGIAAGLAFAGATAPFDSFSTEGVYVAAIVLVVVSTTAFAIAYFSEPQTELREHHLTEFGSAVAEYDPEVLVYVVAAPSEFYFVEQWMEAFNALPLRTMFVARQKGIANRIVGTQWPVVHAPDTRAVEAAITSSTRLAFYTANTGQNVHLVRRADIKHIFLNHGDSDKASSANPVVRMYDEVWVAGQAAADRYDRAGIDLRPGAIRLVGRPQTQPLHVGPLPKRADGRRTVLYAPTFEGHFDDANYSSVEAMGPRIVQSLLASNLDLRIVYRPHPSTGRHLKSVAAASNQIVEVLRGDSDHRVVLPRTESALADDMNEADLVITDVSSVATDFLTTGRPIVATNPRGLDPESFDVRFPNLSSCYRLESDLAGFIEMLSDALESDPMVAARRSAAEHLLGVHPGGPIQTFVKAVESAYAQHVPVDAAKQFRIS